MKTATTIEESHKLLELGIDPETADMFYTNYANKPNDGIAYIGKVGIRKDLIPAWSLSALLDRVIPTLYKNGLSHCYPLSIRVGNFNPNLFTACIDLIEQLVKQGYIKTKKV